MRKALVAANWKVNGNLGDIAAYSASLQCPDPEFVEVAIFPPAVYLSEMARALGQQPAAVGIQDVGIASKGAHTGEIAAQMVAELGGSWAIVGHSERRLDQHETDDLVATKALAALQGGLNAMICVGETLAERQAGHEIAVVERQLEAVLDRLEPNQLAQCGIGYEPVWAIGTGETASPDEAQAMHSFIRAKIGDWDAHTGAAIRIVYGGSVKPENAHELFSELDIDGGLVGGASLSAEDFSTILAAAEKTTKAKANMAD